MILTDFYKGYRLSDAQSRFDIIASTEEYDFFETLVINKKFFNIGGLSFNYVQRLGHRSGKKSDYAITKGSHKNTSFRRPNIETAFAFGDIYGSNDGCIIAFNSGFKEIGIISIEIFIARGLRNDTNSLWDLFIDRELIHEVEELRKKVVTKFVTRPYQC